MIFEGLVLVYVKYRYTQFELSRIMLLMMIWYVGLMEYYDCSNVKVKFWYAFLIADWNMNDIVIT